MWHPFDLIPNELALSPALRNARPAANRTVLFEERALTYFKDKSNKTGQWPLTMDELPGIQITRRGDATSCELEISHKWELDYFRTLSGTMQCAGAWQTPQRWSFLRTFKPMFSGAAPFAPVEVRGRCGKGELVQTHRGTSNRQEERVSVENLLSTYALMAGFPVDAPVPQGSCSLLGEDLIPAGSARIHRSPDILMKHPLAEGLVGCLLDAQGDFPTEFWVNSYGLTVYVFNGVSKAFILTGVEEAV
jgi:hypothetical protein